MKLWFIRKLFLGPCKTSSSAAPGKGITYYLFFLGNSIPICIYLGCCCSSSCINPFLIWLWSSSWSVVNTMLKQGYRRSCQVSRKTNFWWQLMLSISYYTAAAVAITSSRRNNICRLCSIYLICFSINNARWLFLISIHQDWVDCLSKKWMLDYSLYKISDIDVLLYLLMSIGWFSHEEVDTAQLPHMHSST